MTEGARNKAGAGEELKEEHPDQKRRRVSSYHEVEDGEEAGPKTSQDAPSFSSDLIIRIVSWNLNGMKSRVSDGLLSEVLAASATLPPGSATTAPPPRTAATILALQETKIESRDESAMSSAISSTGYAGMSPSFASNHQGKSAGVATFDLRSNGSSSGSGGSDGGGGAPRVVQRADDGRLLATDHGPVVVINAYMPALPEDEPLEAALQSARNDEARRTKSTNWERHEQLRAEIDQLMRDLSPTKPVIFVGDLNAMAGPEDFTHSQASTFFQGRKEREWLHDHIQGQDGCQVWLDAFAATPPTERHTLSYSTGGGSRKSCRIDWVLIAAGDTPKSKVDVVSAQLVTLSKQPNQVHRPLAVTIRLHA